MPINILVVDDSRTIRSHVRRTLENSGEGYQIVEKEDGIQALLWLSSCIQKELPDVIVLDRNMPNMTGDECIRILKQDELWQKIPVIFLTAQSDIHQLVLGLAELGADDYLPKPFDPDELCARVKVMIRIKQAEDKSRLLNQDLEQALVHQQQSYEELKTTKMKLAETEAAAKLTQVFEKFVPKEFLNRIAPEGLEKLQFGKADTEFISILFCDIRSFTSISEKMTPQELVDFLNDYLKRMNRPIIEHQGFVDKFIGDAIMALFSIPEDSKNVEALKSVQAAIGMLGNVELFNQDREKEKKDPLRIGIGIHSGPVIIGTVGSEERMESTVTGDSVNLAARLEGLTKFYRSQILISQSTFELIGTESSIEFRELDLVQVKGKEELVKIYEVCNGDPEPMREKKLNTLEIFYEGLETYRSKKWTQSISKFKECLKECPEDGAAEMFLERCKIFQKKPPPKDWAGQQVFEEK